MIYKTLPHTEKHDQLFFDFKHADENLGIIELDKKYLYFDNARSIEACVKYFLEKDIYKTNNMPNNNKLTFSERYCKAVWLTKEYFKNGERFKNPIGIIWDPVKKHWHIHPGGTRQVVLYYFSKGNFDVLGFNTAGKKVVFNKVFENLHEIKKYYKNDDIYIVVTAEFGSLIPHVHFDQKLLVTHISNAVDDVKKFYSNVYIEANFDLKKYRYKPPTKHTKHVKVIIDEPDNTDNIIKAFLLLPSFEKFNNYGVKIETST